MITSTSSATPRNKQPWDDGLTRPSPDWDRPGREDKDGFQRETPRPVDPIYDEGEPDGMPPSKG